jgi:hypothetical protein
MPLFRLLTRRPPRRLFHSPLILSLPSSIRKYSMASQDVRTKNPLVGLNDSVRARAEPIKQQWKGTSASGDNTKLYIGGQFVESQTDKWIDVLDPVRLAPLHLNRLTDASPRLHKRSSPRFQRRPRLSLKLQSMLLQRLSRHGPVPVY